jgi:5-methylthioadenosine/S-adenosylhomocysteine deaminase
MTTQVDLVISAGRVLTMTPRDHVIEDGAVAIGDGRILWVGPSVECEYTGEREISAPGSVAMPGLVDTHTHVGAHFFGTLCDEENVITAVYDVWFPMELEWDHDSMYAASCLGIWDALRNGVTTVANDQYHAQAAAEAADRLGIRALISREINEFRADPTPRYDRDALRYDIEFDRGRAEEGLAENLQLIADWKGHPRVTPCLGPHAPDLLSGEMLQRIAAEAERYDCKMLMHIAQSQAEIQQIRERSGLDGSLVYLDELGVLGPRVQGHHMVWLSDAEVELAASSGMGISWTPTIMMSCQSFARIDDLLRAGARVGFGTDCFSMDMLEEFRYAIYAANFVRGLRSGYRLGALDLVEMGTARGAECLGLSDQIGTLEAGKLADVILVDFDDPLIIPATNAFESLVYRAKGANVTHTIVGGTIVYESGKLLLADELELLEAGRRFARAWIGRSRDLLARAGVLDRIEPAYLAGVRESGSGG